MDHTPAPAAGGRHRADPGTAAAAPRPARTAVATSTAAATPPTAVAERCPSCASRVGPREEWCSLCHAALRPGGSTSSGDTAVPTAAVVPPVPAAGPPAPADAPGPPAGRGAGEPELDPEVVEEMLAQLAGVAAGPDLRGLASTQAKVLVATLGGLGLTGLLLLAMTAAGAVLG